MRLYARCLPDIFEMITSGSKTLDFRQMECITLENIQTHETRMFEVADIRKLSDEDTYGVKRVFSQVSWDVKLPVFAIELGEEVRIEPAAGIEKAETGERDDNEGNFEFFNQKKKEEK